MKNGMELQESLYKRSFEFYNKFLSLSLVEWSACLFTKHLIKGDMSARRTRPPPQLMLAFQIRVIATNQ